MKLALSAALGALLVATAAHAAAPADTTVTSGYADVDYNYFDVHASGAGSAGVNVWGGKAAVAFPIQGDWGAQIDGSVNSFQAPNSIGGSSQTIASPTGHAFYRDGQWLAGGFVGAEIAPHLDLIGGGLEGQYRPAQNYVVDGQVAYGGLNTNDSPNLWGVRVAGKGFITDDASVGASVNYVNLNGHGASADLWTERLDGEYKIQRTPVSLTLAYEHSNIDRLSLSSDTVLVGVRWNFGGGSLRDRSANGASLPNITDTFGGEAGQGLLGIASAAYGYLF